MIGPALVAIVLAVAATLGAWRTLRTATTHKSLRIVLQVVAAALLYVLLFPPSTNQRFDSATLVVLTPQAGAEVRADLSPGSDVVALPGAVASAGVERAPDLGTALRRHPETERLRVIGGGLGARDRDAARALVVEFTPPAPAAGIVEVDAPSRVAAGRAWNLGGRVEGARGGHVELRDPAGAIVANAPLSDDGRFAVSAQAKHAGNALFSLRVIDAAGAMQDELPLPVVAEDERGMRVLLLAGAPDPDLKYLRRWAVDAGVQLTGRMAVSEGVELRDGTAMVTAQTLAETDVVIVDERAWKTLDGAAKAQLTDAVRGGLGLVLRVAGAMPDDVAAQWQDFGFRIAAADIAQNVSLDSAGMPDAPTLSRRAVTVEGDELVPLVRAGNGAPLALWRAEGQGRVAVWWLGDSYRLSLAGEPGRFGTLWSEALTTIARARASARPQVTGDVRINERSVFCNVAADADIEQPDATRVAVVVEPSDHATRCAAFWPSQAGWHTLASGDDRFAFRVRGAEEGKALAAAQTAQATALLAGRGGGDRGVSLRAVPMPRWPLFLAMLAALTLLWWLERGRAAEIERAGTEA